MAKLTTAGREALSTDAFAIPEKRAYPIHDANHARAALSMVTKYGTATERARVRAAVHRRYPDIGATQDDRPTTSGIKPRNATAP